MLEIQPLGPHLKFLLLCLIQAHQLCMLFLQNAKKDVHKDWRSLIQNNLLLLLIMATKDKTKITEKGLLQEVLLWINYALLKILRNAKVSSFYKLMVEMIYNKINSVESLDQHLNPQKKNQLHQRSLAKLVKCFHFISAKALVQLEI